MEEKISFFERQYKKNETEYCAKYGRLKFLEINSKQFIHLLIMISASVLTSIGSLLLAIFFKVSGLGGFEGILRILWFSGFGIFLLGGILLSIRLPFYKKKSKECKIELLQYKSENLENSTIRK